MEESTSREKVLKKIRHALIYKTDNPYPDIDFDSNLYVESAELPEINFAKEFTNVAGKFVYCENHDDFIVQFKTIIEKNNWKNIFCAEEELKLSFRNANITYNDTPESFLDMEVGITFCEFLISRLGSIMVSAKQAGGRKTFIYPPTHIVVGYTSQMVNDIKDAIEGMQKKYGDKLPSMISMITGPSRTADIEKTLVMGAHGPKELYLFLIEDLD